MANNINFEMTGKLVIGKETDKFKPYQEKVSEKGWLNKTLMFNCLSDTNRHNLTIKSGNWKDESKAQIMTFTKKMKDEHGADVKGEKLTVKWADRFKQEIVDTIAEFKKFVVDIEEPNRRYKLTKALEKLDDGTLEDGELQELKITKDTLKEEVEKSKKKRKEFIAESDFVEFVKKLIDSGKFKDRLFTIRGNIEYSEYNGKYYKSLVPSRIYLAEDDKEQVATADYTVYYNKDALDVMCVDTKERYYLNAFVFAYDNNRGKDIPIPVQLALDTYKSDEKKAKQSELIVKRFFTVDGDGWVECGYKTKLLNGSQSMEITEDMISDTQKEMLELEMITMDEIAKELGQVYGDRVEETKVTGFVKGYTKGVKETVYTDDDFVIKSVSLEDEEDIFGDIDLD